MKLLLVTPAPRGSRKGNRITALRWARILRALGHRVQVERVYSGARADVLIALHARKSHAAVARFRQRWPDGKVIVAITGTDLYQEHLRSRAAKDSVAVADRLVVLQPLAIDALPPEVRRKARVIFQSVPDQRPRRPRPDAFEVVVLGHLRPVKDPFRAALASREMPERSRLEVLHIGEALSETMARRAKAEMARNPRYRWLGELSQPRALALLSAARAVVLSSRSEGGANVVSEAVRCGVPVLASRIPGTVGLLGPGYPGYFPVGDTAALRRLLRKVEEDPAFLERLQRECVRQAPLFTPKREREDWRALLDELGAPPWPDRPLLRRARPGPPQRAAPPRSEA